MEKRVYGAMIHSVPNDKGGEPEMSDGGSAAQFRREAGKARKLAEAAFGEEERRRLSDVAATLDREAAAIEAALAARRRK